ncbi:MAG: hypothetical protein QOH13_2116 [Thermoleophilaceae bacterium]|nr:hypothetical protein [Thermoleophilaceae bacterium]
MLLAVAAVALSPAVAQAKKRPGTPSSRVVLRALGSVSKATPFASGRVAVKRARNAFAHRKLCAASDALGSHHAQVAKRLKAAKRRHARGLTRSLIALDGKSVKARGLVLRSLPAGKACGGKPALAVDKSIKPGKSLGEVGSSGPRPVARVVDASGQAVEFVANELIVSGSDAGVRALVKRWNGKILATVDFAAIGGKGKQFLVQIDVARADETSLSADLAALAKRTRGGAATVSSEQGLELLAAAGQEARRGTSVGVNYVSQGSAIAIGISTESPDGPPGFATTGPGWDSNAFNWTHLSGTSTQGVGTAPAWQLLQRSGRSANKVGLAVLDMGFATTANGADFGGPLTAISNVPFNDALNNDNNLSCGSPCPWHGTNVANTAFAVPDNNAGVAGTGGLVANRIVVFTLYDFFTSIQAILEARVAGAKVMNMSYGAGVPYYLAWSVLPFELATAAVHTSGAILVAASGNDNKNVDDEDCFIVCWENTWWTPCENAGVFCVGALARDSLSKADYSNYGTDGGVDLYAPGTVLVGFDPATPTGTPGHFAVHSVQGTSFASPYLAGVAALVRAADPSMGAGSVETLLKNTAKASPDSKVKRYVDALAAVRRALPRLIRIEQPTDGSALDKGGAITFSAFVYDDGAGTPAPVTWTTEDGTVIGTGDTISTASLSYGTHTVTARTSVGGVALSDRVRLTITNTAPSVRIAQPADGSTFFQNERVPLTGESGDINQPESGNRLREEQVSWYLDQSATPFATGHSATFDPSGVPVGTHTITFRGVDDAGATATAAITVHVAPPSANPPPTVAITSPANGATKPTCCEDPPGQFYAEFDFQADVSDPNGDPLTYTWTETVLPGGTPQLRSTVEDPGTQRVYFTSCNDGGHDWKLSVSDGTNTRSATVRVFLSVIC